jgi:peptidoglycan/xylan/chitin deacetylase (PgdA/CDA1 family)
MLTHLMTVDLDEPVERPSSFAVGPDAFVDVLLSTLDATKARATFFIPQHVAGSSVSVMRTICESGHEVACLTSKPLGVSPPYSSEFRQELADVRRTIEDATGRRVKGHRTARFTVSSATDWAYDVLIDQGFEYDSSRLPRRAEYALPAVPSSPHCVRRWNGTILEIPPTTTQVFSMQFHPVATPAIRHLPLLVSRGVVDRRQRRGDPAMIHLRYSEIVNERSRQSGSAAVANDRGLRRVAGLLAAFQFRSVEHALSNLSRSAPVIES